MDEASRTEVLVMTFEKMVIHTYFSTKEILLVPDIGLVNCDSKGNLCL
jgi:hypothetical protein